MTVTTDNALSADSVLLTTRELSGGGVGYNFGRYFVCLFVHGDFELAPVQTVTQILKYFNNFYLSNFY